MYFRLTFDIPFLAIYEKESFNLNLQSESSRIQLEFSPAAGEFHLGKWKCVSSCEETPTSPVQKLFEYLVTDAFDPAIEWDCHGQRGLELLGPPYFRQFVDKVHSALNVSAMNAVSLMQWRLCRDGPPNPLTEGGRLWWSLDNEDWRAIPGVGGSDGGQAVGFAPIKQHVRDEICSLLLEGTTEPLGHELLREAKQLGARSSRGAFVVAIMAAEVGVKQHISKMLPETEWLLANIQSPPLFKLLEEQLPRTPGRLNFGGKVVAPPPSLRQRLRNAVNIRNDIVHKGFHGSVQSKLHDLVEDVRDLLYLLDYYQGNEWALRFIRREIVQELMASANS